MRFSILTLFPEFFDSPFKASLLGKAISSNLIQTDFIALREFGEGKYRAVDDRPFGGGPGMVMMAPILEKAMAQVVGSEETLNLLETDVQEHRQSLLRTEQNLLSTEVEGRAALPWVVSLSPQGAPLTAAKAKALAQKQHVVLVCGHYEGMDDRFTDAFVHEELSIGDYVLTGGEPAALVVLDAVSRFVGGVIGQPESVTSDTFEASPEMLPGGLKGPAFTRPQTWRGREVPPVLLSGNHGEIRKWRFTQSQQRTQKRRPELGSKKS